MRAMWLPPSYRSISTKPGTQKARGAYDQTRKEYMSKKKTSRHMRTEDNEVSHFEPEREGDARQIHY